MVRTHNGKKIPIGSNIAVGGSGTGEIEFYDVGQRSKVMIPKAKVKVSRTPNGSYKFSAEAPNRSKSGKVYTLHRFSKTPP